MSDYHLMNELKRRLSTIERNLTMLSDERQAQAVLLKQAVTLMEILVKQHAKLFDAQKKSDEVLQ